MRPPAPFDVQTTIDYGFSLEEYDKAYREALYRFVQCEKEPTCVNSDSDFNELKLLRRLNRITPIMPIEILEEEANYVEVFITGPSATFTVRMLNDDFTSFCDALAVRFDFSGGKPFP